MTRSAAFKRLASLAEKTRNVAEDPLDPGDFLYLWRGVYEYGTGDKPDPSTIEEITDLWAISPEGGDSVELVAVMRLIDGRYATCVAYADYTGFGCEHCVDWRINATKEDALSYGLDREARVHLGIEPGVSPQGVAHD